RPLFHSSTHRRHPSSTLFPYTTLFRSHPGRERQDQRVEERVAPGLSAPHQGRRRSDRRRLSRRDQHASRAPCVECRFRRGDRKGDRKSTRLNSSHVKISYAVFCLKKKK